MRSVKNKWLFAMLALGLIAAFPLAAATTAELTLTGVMPKIVEISISADPKAADLDLENNVGGLQIATVTEKSNSRAGYTVTLKSTNALTAGSPVFKSSGVTETLAYTLTYDGTTLNFTSGQALISDLSGRADPTGIKSKALTISYDGASAFIPDGTYSDTLTFTIAAK